MSDRIKVERRSNLAHGPMTTVSGIIVHETGVATAASTLNNSFAARCCLAIVAVTTATAGAAIAHPAPMRVTSVETVAPAKFVIANAPEALSDCKHFRPSREQLRAWFAHAQRVDRSAWLEDGDQSACQLSGVVRTETGIRRNFDLGRGGMGRLEAGLGAFVYLLGPEFPVAGSVAARRR